MVCVYHILFIRSFVDGHVDRFDLSAPVKNAALNMRVQISVSVAALSSLGHIPRGRSAISYGNSMFDFLRKTRCLSQWLHDVLLPSAMHDGSNFFISFPILIIFHFFG